MGIPPGLSNTPLPGSTALDNILTAIKNLVQAVSTAAINISQFSPDLSSGQLTANTLVQAGFVRVFGISVTTAGATGTLNDASTISNATSGNVIYVTPAQVGYIPFNPAMIFTNGLVYEPGASQVLTIFYSRS